MWGEGGVNSRFEKMVEKLGTEEDEQHKEDDASARTVLTSIQSLFTNFVMPVSPLSAAHILSYMGLAHLMHTGTGQTHTAHAGSTGSSTPARPMILHILWLEVEGLVAVPDA